MKTQFFSEVARKHTEDDAEKVVICGAPGTIPDPATLSSECPRPWLYTRVLAFFALVTALLFLATAMLNRGAISNVLVIGALAAPFTILTLFFELNVYRNISFYTVVKAFAIGGAMSMLVVPFLPTALFMGTESLFGVICVGLGEELAKAIVVYFILKRNRAYPYILNGLLVGAAVGAGFAAFETASYAMNNLAAGNGTWLGQGSLFVLALRNVLAPGGHVVWAAISGGAMLVAMRREPISPRVWRTRAFLGFFLVSVALHALWDYPFGGSGISTIERLFVLTLAAWLVVVWLVRRGLLEVDEAWAVVVPCCTCRREPMVPAVSWRRFFAKLTDLGLMGVAVSAPICQLSEYFSCAAIAQGSAFLFLILPLSLFGEWVVYELFGTSFGKWAFSIRVEDSEGNPIRSPLYLKRQVWLWGEGFAFGIPGAQLIAQGIQYIRLRREGHTTYDGKFGFVVVQGRLRPWRCLLAVPFLLVVFLLPVAVLPDDEGAETPVESHTVDPKILEALQAAQLKYSILDGGWVQVPFETEHGRQQDAFIAPKCVSAASGTSISVTSPCASVDSMEKADVLSLLGENTKHPEGAWILDENVASFKILLALDAGPEKLRELIAGVVEYVDGVKDTLTNGGH